MKNYTITVNGTAYNVTVEEVGAVNYTPAQAPVFTAPVVAPTPVAAPVAAPAPVATPAPAPAASGVAGGIKVDSPMPGKILSIKVSNGTAVKKGDVLMILEAMKMENEIVAPEDGTVASINVNEGASVEAGTLLATLN